MNRKMCRCAAVPCKIMNPLKMCRVNKFCKTWNLRKVTFSDAFTLYLKKGRLNFFKKKFNVITYIIYPLRTIVPNFQRLKNFIVSSAY